jgi:hypothetical protein
VSSPPATNAISLSSFVSPVFAPTFIRQTHVHGRRPPEIVAEEGRDQPARYATAVRHARRSNAMRHARERHGRSLKPVAQQLRTWRYRRQRWERVLKCCGVDAQIEFNADTKCRQDVMAGDSIRSSFKIAHPARGTDTPTSRLQNTFGPAGSMCRQPPVASNASPSPASSPSVLHGHAQTILEVGAL